MKLKETFVYPDTEVESVYALISDEAFRERSAAATGAVDLEVTIEPSGDGHTVTIIRTQPAEMPDFIKKFIGNSVKIKQTEKWGGPNGDGGRTADVKFSVIGQPAEMLGTVTLSGSGDVSFVIEGDVKVNVPFLGRKIEPEIAKAVRANVRHDVNTGVETISR